MRTFLNIFTIKIIFCVAMILLGNYSEAQEKSLQTKVNELKSEIKSSHSLKKLQLLDSLCTLTQRKTGFNFDSISRVTIEYAIEIDSFRVATKVVPELIRYHTRTTRNPQEGILVFKEFISKEIPVIDDGKLMYFLYARGADSYMFSGNLDEAHTNYKKASIYAKKTKDTVMIGHSIWDIAKNYLRQGKYSDALIFFNKAEHVFSSIKEPNRHVTGRLISIKNSYADIYSYLGLHEQAKKRREEAIALAIPIKEHIALIVAHHNASDTNMLLENYDEALYHLKEAFKYDSLPDYAGIKDRYRERIICELLSAYATAGHLDEARIYFDIIQRDSIRYNSGRAKDYYKRALINYYYVEGNYFKSIELTERFLEQQQQFSKPDAFKKLFGHGVLYRNYESVNDNLKAYEHFKIYKTIKDSLANVKKTQSLLYYQTLYEAEKKDAEIAIKASSIKLLEEQNKFKQYWMVFGGITAFMILLFFFIRYRQQIKYKALENQLLNTEIEYKKKDLIHLALDITNNREWALILADKLKIVKSSRGKKRANELDSLETEIKNKIWVDESTEDFHNKIELLSSSFFDKLNKEFPDLTKSEKRLCSLIKMRMDTKQIAILQNINPSSVKMSRNRLRKKLNLTPSVDLNRFLETY